MAYFTRKLIVFLTVSFLFVFDFSSALYALPTEIIGDNSQIKMTFETYTGADYIGEGESVINFQGMFPGESRLRTGINISNLTSERTYLNLFLENTDGNTLLMDELYISVVDSDSGYTYIDDVILSDIIGEGSLASPTGLITALDAGEDVRFNVLMRLDDTIDDSYQSQTLLFDLRLGLFTETGEIIDDVELSANSLTATGDDMNFFLKIAIGSMFLSLILFAVSLYAGKKKSKID